MRLICSSCAALDTSAKLRFHLHLLLCWSTKGRSWIEPPPGRQSANVMTSDSFHFIGIYQGSTARCNFKKCCQLFIGTHNETLPVAVRVHNPDRSPFTIQRRKVVPTPSGSAEIINDDF